MFESFSRGYYVGRLVVEPHAGEDALMQREQHERVNEQLYATGEGVERLDYPLVMKLWNRHFPVHGDEAVPDNTLFVPSHLVEDPQRSPLPDIEEVLLAKPEIVPRILEWAGGGADVVAT